MEPQDAREAAEARAEAAGRRTREISDRLTRLAEGQRPSETDLKDAQQRADDAQERAKKSLDRAVIGHERAALSHERTAAVHDEARRRGFGDAAEHARLAEQHRRDAAADREGAAADRARREAAHPPAGSEAEPV
ncbi:hypothetical protein [Blastococcus haudaquaticus]|uniref:Colicin import membrane protein n=1 Tax=Blastococcus haudaquaticus TaxID=1938745 RepID=A0A286GQF1_9ACTN|nr:hypothetical protein [Blastococcus haudaquaticus]SOD97738.1 hypothetical protein SAMN06272739_1600 [Blastococcus haudaquaticus]